ncbi:MAG: type 4a pilus biogenesis protein PilO [Actinomycetota bacterium]|jgi:Tfp pilus assembly protein PilO|nr:type 4a pilus biogenesis protein PilO [Actinomycetota bacterium]
MRRVGLLAILAAVLVTAAWWMFLVSPRNGRIADLRDDLTVAEDTEGRLRVQIRQLEEIRDREVEYLAALGQLESLIPERPLLDEFIEEIFALTNETGVELQGLAPAVPAIAAEGSELREVAVSAQIEGQFFEVLGFLFGLNEMERLVRVDAIAVSSSESESGITILSVAIEMRLFTLADLLPPLDDIVVPGSGDTTTTTVVEGGDAEAGEELSP